jgi:hypothetical protein
MVNPQSHTFEGDSVSSVDVAHSPFLLSLLRSEEASSPRVALIMASAVTLGNRGSFTIS